MRVAEASVLAMLPATGLAACGTAYPSATIDGTLLRSIVLDMGTDAAAVTNTIYDSYFKEGNATTGVQAVIAASNFYINKWSIPGTEDLYNNNSVCASTGYLVNQVHWLYYDTTAASWYGGYEAETADTSYDAATLDVVTAIVAGLEVRFWDTNGDGYTDLIDADYLQGVTIDTVTENANGTYTIFRGTIDTEMATAEDGTIFDADLFSGAGPAIPAENFDTTIASGDVALFWYGQNGWAMERALEVAGIFNDGADHTYYEIDGVEYADALRFSRDNIFISNRPGEITDAQKFFGLMNNTAAGLDVSLWLVPVTNTSNFGAPISITSGGNADDFLTTAVGIAQTELDSVVISTDGSDVPSTQNWVNQTVYDQLEYAIGRANLSLSLSNSTSFLFDYQTYVLYQTLTGSGDDIGAQYAGFSYTGFENEEAAGLA